MPRGELQAAQNVFHSMDIFIPEFFAERRPRGFRALQGHLDSRFLFQKTLPNCDPPQFFIFPGIPFIRRKMAVNLSRIIPHVRHDGLLP